MDQTSFVVVIVGALVIARDRIVGQHSEFLVGQRTRGIVVAQRFTVRGRQTFDRLEIEPCRLHLRWIGVVNIFPQRYRRAQIGRFDRFDRLTDYFDERAYGRPFDFGGEALLLHPSQCIVRIAYPLLLRAEVAVLRHSKTVSFVVAHILRLASGHPFLDHEAAIVVGVDVAILFGEIVVDGDCQRIAEQVTAFGRDDPPQPAVVVVDGVGVDRFVVIERAAQQRPPQSVGEALHDMAVGIGRHGA